MNNNYEQVWDVLNKTGLEFDGKMKEEIEALWDHVDLTVKANTYLINSYECLASLKRIRAIFQQRHPEGTGHIRSVKIDDKGVNEQDINKEIEELERGVELCHKFLGTKGE